MRLSFSSFIISMGISILFIYVFNLLLKSYKHYHKLRIDFMNICIHVIMIKLLIPCELLYTFSIPSHYIMLWFYRFFYFPIKGIPLYRILIFLWICGRVACLLFFSKKLINVHQFIKKIPDEPLYKNGIRYYRTDLVDTPVVIGIKGYILIPKNGYEKELDYILLHEQEHIKKHDILKKYFVYFLIMIYWWFFPVYKLKEQVDLIIEMNVDFRVTKNMNKDEFFDYAQSIISCMTQSSSQGIGFSIDEHNDMKYRMKYLMEGYQAKKTNPLILATLGFVVFLSSLVVFEPIPLN